jgi:MIP family channel proteins
MKKYLAEFIGTFALILVGAGAVCQNQALVVIALAHGLTVATMIYAMGHISGIHINPAVTISMLVTGKIDVKDSIGYVISQLLGAALAGFMLKQLFVAGIAANHLGTPGLAVTVPMGFLCEAVGTFLFFIVIFGAAVDGRTAGNVAGLAIGLSLVSLIMIFGPLTGASFNPARSFGPALLSNHWNDFWIYVVGPIVGGVAAGLVQTQIFIKEQPAKPQASSYKP